ncbi:uncharacterized protein LOC125273771 [Megalobrama amblycephala]|uniref:uncharacterized protein LOC125273771 n=1 Tax=Megalobrama amblycephala TaxID=75352 RepID=UPI0020140B7E|nr:uncharacterized protein LOC125273771 [Megalobrama amblycephala]
MNSYDCSQSGPEDEQPSNIPPPHIGLNNGSSMARQYFMPPPCPPPPPPSPEYRDEVESTSYNKALPRSDAIETQCGVITPENLIWDPPNLQELGPLKFVGVYNLPPAFWPASLMDRVKYLGNNVDGTNRADDSSTITNLSSSVPHNMSEELLENLDCAIPEDIFKIPDLTFDAHNGRGRGQASAGVMEAAATDSEELLPYFTGSRKRKRAIYSDNELSPATAESFEML